jgi:hypothetical protein
MAASMSTQSRKQWESEHRLKSWEDAHIDSEDDDEPVLKQLKPKVLSNHERALNSLVEFYQHRGFKKPC